MKTTMREIQVHIFPKWNRYEQQVTVHCELDDWNNPIKFIAKDMKTGRIWQVHPKESKRDGMIFKIKGITYLCDCWDIETKYLCSWFFREYLGGKQ